MKFEDVGIKFGNHAFMFFPLDEINRGDSSENMRYWIKKTKQKGLNVCGHLIYGLPGETQDMMLNTLDETIALQVDSIKFHPL